MPLTKNQTIAVQQTMQVRRLTPRECERLQGFPDDYTLIPYRNKPACDGPRYKALGNSMAVPVMRWIGKRLQAVNEID
jgi:DNA (cytosine-5)-methyltransferase 1